MAKKTTTQEEREAVEGGAVAMIERPVMKAWKPTTQTRCWFFHGAQRRARALLEELTSDNAPKDIPLLHHAIGAVTDVEALLFAYVERNDSGEPLGLIPERALANAGIALEILFEIGDKEDGLVQSQMLVALDLWSLLYAGTRPSSDRSMDTPRPAVFDTLERPAAGDVSGDYCDPV